MYKALSFIDNYSMIIYSSSKTEFREDVRNNLIDQKIHNEFQRNLGHRTAITEVNSWRNSMMYMSNILDDSAIPDSAGVYIEYILPRSTKKRIDFIITGQNRIQEDSVVIIELKQWSEVEKTDQPGVVMSATQKFPSMETCTTFGTCLMRRDSFLINN